MKIELQAWIDALALYDAQDFEGAQAVFERMQQKNESAKIEFNRAVIHATLGDHKRAVELFASAVRLDPYFAIAYFQSGVCNFLRGRYTHSRHDFETALHYMRGNSWIDYSQLGLDYRLVPTEIFFNLSLTYYYAGQAREGQQHLDLAREGANTEQLSVIDDALADDAVGYMPFSVQPGLVFRPNERQVRNLKPRDFIGQAKVVFARPPSVASTVGPEIISSPQSAFRPSLAPLSSRPDSTTDAASSVSSNLTPAQRDAALKRNPTHWQPKKLNRQASERAKPGAGVWDPSDRSGVRSPTPASAPSTVSGRVRAPSDASPGLAGLGRARTIAEGGMHGRHLADEGQSASAADFVPEGRLVPPPLNRSVSAGPATTLGSSSASTLPSRKASLRYAGSRLPSSLNPSPSVSEADEDAAAAVASCGRRKSSFDLVEAGWKDVERQRDGGSSTPSSSVTPGLRLARLDTSSSTLSRPGTPSSGGSRSATTERPPPSVALPSRSATLAGRSGRKSRPGPIDTARNIPANWPRSADTSPVPLSYDSGQEADHHLMFSRERDTDAPPRLPQLSVGGGLLSPGPKLPSVQGGLTPSEEPDGRVAFALTPATPAPAESEFPRVRHRSVSEGAADQYVTALRDAERGYSSSATEDSPSPGWASFNGSQHTPMTAASSVSAAASSPQLNGMQPLSAAVRVRQRTLGKGSGSLRRRGTYGAGGVVKHAQSVVADDEESGYGSAAEYYLQAGSPIATGMPFPETKVRFKLHYMDHVRGMLVSPDMTFDDFLTQVLSKFGKRANAVRLRFRDEDGTRITIQDASDLELAIETARLQDGKINVSLEDV